MHKTISTKVQGKTNFETKLNNVTQTFYFLLFMWFLDFWHTRMKRLIKSNNVKTTKTDKATIFIPLVFEYPFSVNDMNIFRPWSKFPHLISHKLIQLFMHWLNPVFILESFFYPFWLKLSKVTMVCYMIGQKDVSFTKAKTFI